MFIRCLMSVGLFWLGYASADSIQSHSRVDEFDIRLGFLHAGSLESNLSIENEKYEFTGVMRTSRFIEHFFKWQGTFAATGVLVEGVPTQGRYLVISDNKTKKDKKIVLKTEDSTTILRTNREKKKIAAPVGIDLISALLLLDQCDELIKVHDGEDEYHLYLDSERSRTTELRLGKGYYSGEAAVCAYKFQYKRNVTRRFNVWVAEINDALQPVRIQLKFPFRPSVVMSLRIDS